MRRILCLIDALGPGGAERQMVGLATMLSRQGCNVEVCYFEPKHFFADQIRNDGIDVKYIAGRESKIELIKNVSKECQHFCPDIVISYLQTSSIIASVLRLIGLKFKLIVSERNTDQKKNLRNVFRFNLFRIADYVVPNSYSQQKFINEHFDFLKYKIKVITNFVDTEKFCPKTKHNRSNLIVVVATIWSSKNTLGLIRALAILKGRGVSFKVKWFGKVEDKAEYLNQCEALIKELKLEDNIELLDKTQNIVTEYQKADFFCLPSFYEGTPNVICEAMSCGLPIICSDVCDNSRYVSNRKNGYLFEPMDVNSIADALDVAIKMSDVQYASMSNESRKLAIDFFSSDLFVSKYLNLF